MATTVLAVRAAVVSTDGHGTRSVTSWAPPGPARPGRIVSEPAQDGEKDGPGGWVLGVDPALWPIQARDLIVEPGGREWVVTTAAQRRNAANAALDWVRVEAYLNEGGPGRGERVGG